MSTEYLTNDRRGVEAVASISDAAPADRRRKCGLDNAANNGDLVAPNVGRGVNAGLDGTLAELLTSLLSPVVVAGLDGVNNGVAGADAVGVLLSLLVVNVNVVAAAGCFGTTTGGLGVNNAKPYGSESTDAVNGPISSFLAVVVPHDPHPPLDVPQPDEPLPDLPKSNANGDLPVPVLELPQPEPDEFELEPHPELDPHPLLLEFPDEPQPELDDVPQPELADPLLLPQPELLDPQPDDEEPHPLPVLDDVLLLLPQPEEVVVLLVLLLPHPVPAVAVPHELLLLLEPPQPEDDPHPELFDPLLLLPQPDDDEVPLVLLPHPLDQPLLLLLLLLLDDDPDPQPEEPIRDTMVKSHLRVG
jgi:hypothetical protein